MPPTPTELHNTAASHELRLARLEERLAQHLADYEEFKKALAQATIELRELEDWRLEMSVYLKQIRWTLLVAVGAMIIGLVNLFMELNLH